MNKETLDSAWTAYLDGGCSMLLLKEWVRAEIEYQFGLLVVPESDPEIAQLREQLKALGERLLKAEMKLEERPAEAT